MLLTLPSWASSRSYGESGPSWGERRFIWSRVGYSPLPGGQEAFHRSEARERLVAGGEGAGNSLIGAMELVARLFWGERFWIIGPDYWHCRQEFEYVHEAMKVLGAVQAVSMPVEGQCRLTLKGGLVVETMSSQDERRLAMQGVDGALMVEAAQQSLEAYYRARGRVARTRGWLVMTGVFEGSLGWYPEMFQAWQGGGAAGQSFSLPTWENVHLYPGGRSDPEILQLEQSMTRDRFMERHAGEPSPPAGRVVAEFSARQNVRDVQVVDGLPVEVTIDPGYAGAYAVLFVQVVDGQVRVLDEVYEQGLDTYQVIGLVKKSPLWERVKGGVCDIAGTQHQALPPVVHVWYREAGIRLRTKRVLAAPGIERLRQFARLEELRGEPRLLVHPRCRAFIAECGGGPHPVPGMGVWRRKVDRSGNTIGPPMEENNHACKAMIYYLVDRFGYAVRQRDRQRPAEFIFG